MKKFKIRKKDTVVVISGKYKGNVGKVISVLSERDLVIVEGVNKVWKHVKATSDQPGRKFQKEAPIHISNVAMYDSETQSRVKVGNRTDTDTEGGKSMKVRFNKSSGKTINT
jgi:large subunit ribosomal protein L24